VRRANVFLTSAFRLTLLYVALFCVSVLALLAFIYWSTVGVIERQTEQTIQSEIRGLAEQYRLQGLPRLLAIDRERSGLSGDPANVYLLAGPDLTPMAGNLDGWPRQATAGSGDEEWIDLPVGREDDPDEALHVIRARTFTLSGGFRLLVGRDTRQRQAFRRTVVQALGWSVAGMVLLGLVGGLLISRGMLTRVDGIARTANQIVSGDLSRRLAVRGSGDEFDRLAESLNVMLDRIDRLMTGMRLATDSLAHDLRGPLTRLKSRIELALRDAATGDGDRAVLEGILEDTDAALAMFDSLLRIALAEGGAKAGEMGPVDLCELVRDGAELYEPLAEQKGVTLRISAPAAAPIRGHAELLSQAVADLLDNAVKYTPAGGAVTLTVVGDDDRVGLTVADTGPGVPAADRSRVLERFVRLDASRGGPGAGLGLSLVAAVARLHGATLVLDDNRPGLCVALSFPLAKGVAGT